MGHVGKNLRRRSVNTEHEQGMTQSEPRQAVTLAAVALRLQLLGVCQIEAVLAGFSLFDSSVMWLLGAAKSLLVRVIKRSHVAGFKAKLQQGVRIVPNLMFARKRK